MGSFEDSIKKSFEGKEIKAPTSVWNQVENGLNADFVSSYQTRQMRYKWVAVAAMLLAFFSFALHFSPIYPDLQQETTPTNNSGGFNALLTEGSGFISGFNRNNMFAVGRGFSPIAIVGKKQANEEVVDEATSVASTEPFFESFDLESITPDLQLAQVNSDIYWYHKGGAYSTLSSYRKRGGNGIWAGLEAGAGNFSSSLASSNVYAGSINQSNLASALGSDGFVNPSTEVNPDLNNGIATSLAVGVGMRLGRKWTFETGLAYTNVDARGDATINVLDIYTVDNSEFFGAQGGTDLPISSSSRETSFEVEDSYDYNVGLRSNLRFTSIPVKAGYFLMDRKMSLRLNVGVAANYFMGSQVTANNNVLNGSIDDSFNAWSFDGLGGFEIGYSILDNFDVTFEPNYRQSITPLTDSNATESRFLVQTGLKYRIQ